MPSVIGRGQLRQRSESGRRERSIEQFVGSNFEQCGGQFVESNIRGRHEISGANTGPSVGARERGEHAGLAGGKPGPK
ncbi:MAG: hypothetical protein WBF06_15325 [Candidatus Acidiferrales bacterium]